MESGTPFLKALHLKVSFPQGLRFFIHRVLTFPYHIKKVC